MRRSQAFGACRVYIRVVHGHWSWVFGKPEQGLESFYAWMDQEQHRVADQKGAWLGAILGSTWGMTGGAIGGLVGGLQVPAAYIPLIIAPATIVTIFTLRWYFLARSEEEKSTARLRGEARGVIQRLWMARITQKLHEVLGEEAVYLLNEGAKQWFRCKTALDSPVIKATSADSPWRQARDSGLRSMDAAMARLVLLCGNGAVPSRETGPAPHLLEDMRQMADEASKMAEKLAKRTGISSGDASSDLRRVIGELKMLSAADDEYDRIREEL